MIRALRKVSVGDKLKFKSEKQRYTVRACDNKFVIATKPFNARKTYLYTIIDIDARERGSDNYYCKFDYEKKSDLILAMAELHNGKMCLIDTGFADCGRLNLSHRTKIKLDLERIDIK